MRFRIIASDDPIPANVTGPMAFLHIDRWNDWWEFVTQYHLTVVDNRDVVHAIGWLKIGAVDLKAGKKEEAPPTSPNLPITFELLSEEFFSLGQHEDYYDELLKLGDELRVEILTALRDIAFDDVAWEIAKNERVTEKSLLRHITRTTVLGQFRRMSRGYARLTRYSFSYTPPKHELDNAADVFLDFHVDPESPLPSNVHVLIGRNGVGKTRFLELMAKAVVGFKRQAEQSGKFEFLQSSDEEIETFANVVSVGFSWFDARRSRLADRKPDGEKIGYSFIGLLRFEAPSESRPGKGEMKAPAEVSREFTKSFMECQWPSRNQIWGRILKTLESDPIIRDADLWFWAGLTHSSSNSKTEELTTLFNRLSSGHKIVLLTLVRLVELVEERTLVLIDEPESHLHPPLLSAMIRAISELMIAKNGVAIVATHSPVVLQEVPKNCVWILNRFGKSAKAERPSIETFGEGVGVLSREVFQLELTQSGYHTILQESANENANYDSSLEALGGSLGSEARAVLRGLFVAKNESEEI